MVSQQIIADVIQAQAYAWLKKNWGVSREMTSEIPHATGFASIITGLRRSGKSTMMMQVLQQNFQEKALFLNFEDPRLATFSTEDFERLYNEIINRKNKLLFFDEIQIISGWEIFVNQLLREDFKVFITGSNASLLSRELGTHLTGRHFSTELFPFSYSEFLTYFKREGSEKTFADYLQKGGMPDYLRTNVGTYLNTLLDDIIIRDIAIRHGLRDVNSLRQLTVYLLSNIGNLISANGLVGMFGVKSATTLLHYFSFLSDAYIVEFVPLFDYSLKKQIRNPQKVYAIDLGMYHQNKIVFSPNYGAVLENAVYLHLRKKYKDIFYFQNQGECDFVTTINGHPEDLYQVCYDLNSMNLYRETEGLYQAMDFFKKEKAFIITMNQKDIFKKNNKTIDVIPAWQWILQK
ncbi:ATP-binding protein [Flavobacterium filum]|uniref:ATP-binding protein n=1 Tax=Flavobacterium TaxID=237 RepID=UPI0004095B33|nr:ATP-binding protein [Flavobacterium filum]